MIRLAGRAAARAYQSAVAWSLVFTLVRVGGNLLVLPLMLHKLSAEHLGLWYVFLSLATASSLIDLGFFPTMARVTAYIWAGANEIHEMGVTPVQVADAAPTGPNLRLLADLVRTMRLYYRAAGIVLMLVLGVGGTVWILSKTQPLPNTSLVLLAWFLFLIGILVNTTNGMWHPLLAGINHIRLSQQILVYGLIANYVTILVGLILGAGLLAPVTGYLLMGIVSQGFSRMEFRRLSQTQIHEASSRASASLLRKLWPTAWRSGVVTLGIYATVSFGTLICSHFLGLKATASYGLSLQLVLAAMGIATSFVSVKIPMIAQMHARGETRRISGVIFPRLRWFWSAYIGLSAAAILFGERVVRDILHSRTTLLPTPLFFALFLVIGLEGHHAIFRDVTITAHRNPFAKPVIISAALIVVLSFVLVPQFGLWGLILAPGLVQICFNNWWTVVVGLESMGNSVSDYIYALLGLTPTESSTI
jgi:O-antigen/teichoic acid export membrane protein